MAVSIALFEKPLNDSDAMHLRNIQGNILKSHGRNYAAHCFLEFRSDKLEEVRQFLRQIRNDYPLTSVAQQQDDACAAAEGDVTRMFRGMSLSVKGYQYLGFETEGRFPADFIHGMKSAGPRLNDSHPLEWDPKYLNAPHIMLTIANNDKNKIEVELNAIRKAADGLLRRDWVENGISRLRGEDERIEHFGFTDGISNPLFFQRDVDKHLSETPRGTASWNPAAAPNLVLTKDPFGGQDGWGSFLVFRKLEQRVRDFFEYTNGPMNHKERAPSDTRPLAAALLVGRFQNGAPLAVCNETERLNLGNGIYLRNNFTYSSDPDGIACPFSSHIRRLDSRENTESLLTRRIARRSMPYGTRDVESWTDINKMPNDNVGTLFMCYQGSISKQFQFLQREWANNPNHPKQGTAMDPIAGQAAGGLSKFTKLKGGEYFFSPSISFFERI